MKEEVVETDVLCVGGGIAGLMAAIRAAECGASVTVAEKGNTLRSGAAATGNDHFMCYIPEVHGPDYQAVVKELQLGFMSWFVKNPLLARAWLEKTHAIISLWDGWGIPMKYEGRYEFAGHTFPGRQHVWLKYAGQMQKPILTREAQKRGVTIMNRMMVLDLLGEKEVTGALGIGTREDRLVVFRAKSVVLGTGAAYRLFPSATPGWMFNNPWPGSVTGDGRAMAYRCGADLMNMELHGRHAGPKYFARAGQATWTGVIRDSAGRAVGPFLQKPDKQYSDMVIEVHRDLFIDAQESGRGPLYMDCRGISDADRDYMMHWLREEGNTAMVNHLNEEGIDVRRHPVEFMTYATTPLGMIPINERGETSLPGLYAAGDDAIPTISPAATFGWIAGEHAAAHARSAEMKEFHRERDSVAGRKELLERLRGRSIGPDWKEVNIALQQIMHDYAGRVRSETLLDAGLQHLRRIRRKAYDTMIARNQHELARCCEVLNLFDLGELVFVASKVRRETRGVYVRSDYPFTNPLMEGPLMVRNVEGKPTARWLQAG